MANFFLRRECGVRSTTDRQPGVYPAAFSSTPCFHSIWSGGRLLARWRWLAGRPLSEISILFAAAVAMRTAAAAKGTHLLFGAAQWLVRAWWWHRRSRRQQPEQTGRALWNWVPDHRVGFLLNVGEDFKNNGSI